MMIRVLYQGNVYLITGVTYIDLYNIMILKVYNNEKEPEITVACSSKVRADYVIKQMIEKGFCSIDLANLESCDDATLNLLN